MECAGERPPQRRSAPPPRPPPPGSSTAGRGERSQQATTSFRTFQKLHDKVYTAVQKGLSADEEGDSVTAEHSYASGLALLEEALAVDCENMPEATSDEKDAAKQMAQKMQKTKMQITYRLESIRGTTVDQLAVSSFPNLTIEEEEYGVRLPSYEEALSSSHSSLTSEANLGDSIMAAEYPGIATNAHCQAEGTELFSLPEGVQIFHITREGFVSAPTYPTSLHIVKLRDVTEGEPDYMQAVSGPPAFLQVGEWFYPLIPGASPALHTSYGAYLFPDLTVEGSSVGLMLPDNVSPDQKQMLEDILKNYSAIQEQQALIQPEDLAIPSAPMLEPEEGMAPEGMSRTGDATRGQQAVEDRSTSSKISQGILVASKWISWGVGKGAEKAGELISYGSSKLRDKLRPELQARTVDPRLQKGMVYTRKATHVAVTVSGYVVSKLGEATMALGRRVAPHIRKKGEELMPKSMKSDKNKSTLDGVIEVAASGLQGFGTVYLSLEGAAKALAKNLANETVTTVQHKYGNEAGRFAEDTVYAAGNVAMAAYNVDNLGIKALAKRAAKDTGKAVLADVQEKRKAGQLENGHTSGASVDGNGKGQMGRK